jgi:hypothetical protein
MQGLGSSDQRAVWASCCRLRGIIDLADPPSSRTTSATYFLFLASIPLKHDKFVGYHRDGQRSCGRTRMAVDGLRQSFGLRFLHATAYSYGVSPSGFAPRARSEYDSGSKIGLEVDIGGVNGGWNKTQWYKSIWGDRFAGFQAR